MNLNESNNPVGPQSLNNAKSNTLLYDTPKLEPPTMLDVAHYRVKSQILNNIGHGTLPCGTLKRIMSGQVPLAIASIGYLAPVGSVYAFKED